MAYTTAEGRQRLLDTLAQAADALGLAVASLTAAYEQLDERTADRLEAELFRPVQSAYGRARRAYGEFAARHDLSVRGFDAPAPGAPGRGVAELVQRAVDDVEEADRELAELQDSLLPVEVGDAEVRAAISDVRRVLDHTRAHAHELMRTFGR